LTRHQRYFNKIKTKAYEILGNICECCKEKELSFLTIDHLNSDGNKHRAKIGRSSKALYIAVIRSTKPREQFKLLCANCHISKTRLGQCIHELKSQGTVTTPNSNESSL
jgi:hypothetical protein